MKLTEAERKMLAALRAKKDALTADEKAFLAELEAKEAKEKESDNIVTLDQVGKVVAEAVGKEIKTAMEGIAGIIKDHKAPGYVQDPGSKQSFKEILIGIKTKHPRIIDKYKLIRADKFFEGENAKVLAEGVGATGGFLVPVEQSNKLLNLITEKSVIRQILTKLGNVWPMSSMTQTVPLATVGVTAFWIAENGPKTASDPTLGQMVLTAFKLCCLTGVSDELLADSDPRIDDLLYNLFAMAMIRGEETAFVNGTGVAPADPILGIYNWPGIGTVPYSGDLMDDMIDAIGTVEETDGEVVSILHPGRDKRKLRKMKDDNGDYLWQKPADKNTPATFMDADIYKDKYIPVNLGAAANQSYQIAGDFNYAVIGDRQAVEIASSAEWCFDHDQTYFRAVRRVAFRIADPTKFCRITGVTMA